MPIPTWSPGQVLTSSDVNNYFVPLAVVKASDESVTSSTALQDDNDFQFAVTANAKYTFDAFVSYTGGTADSSDLKCTFSFPSGLTMKYGILYFITPGGALTLSITRIQTDTNTVQTSAVNEKYFLLRGIVLVSSTAGTLTFRWAQNTSNGTATTIKANSWFSLQRVA